MIMRPVDLNPTFAEAQSVHVVRQISNPASIG